MDSSCAKHHTHGNTGSVTSPDSDTCRQECIEQEADRKSDSAASNTDDDTHSDEPAGDTDRRSYCYCDTDSTDSSERDKEGVNESDGGTCGGGISIQSYKKGTAVLPQMVV